MVLFRRLKERSHTTIVQTFTIGWKSRTDIQQQKPFAFTNASMAAQPKIFGSTLERRMWLKKYFRYLPFRFIALFLYLYIGCGCWRVGWSGYAWSKLRSDVMRFREFKRKEMELTGKPAEYRKYGAGFPDKRVPQF